jgi:hypothetical protein
MTGPSQNALPYRHTQIGYPILVGLGLGAMLQVRAYLRDVKAGARGAWPRIPQAILFVALMVAFSRLTVEVDGSEVTASFACGLARRRINLRTIESASVSTLPWLSGWGIRFTPRGWVYNASGRGAVEIRRSTGRRFTIGSDEPAALLAAIENARARLAGS